MSRLPAGVAFTVIRFGGRRVRILRGLGCIRFGIALLFRRCYANIWMLGRFGFFELTLIMGAVRVSSSSTTISPFALVAALNPFGIRAGLVCHFDAFGFG